MPQEIMCAKIGFQSLCIQKAFCEGVAEHAGAETLAVVRSGTLVVILDSAATARLSRLLI